jgi:7,8-dihydroneopterin aldolase/epimerase/oxygenase
VNALTELDLMRTCRRLFLRNHEVMVRIGAHDFEQHAPQRVLINVQLFVPLASTLVVNDKLAEVVDYDFIRQVVAERISRGHIQLQETLVDDLLAKLLAHPQVQAAGVSSEKPDVYADCAAVGVEVFGFKAPVTA